MSHKVACFVWAVVRTCVGRVVLRGRGSCELQTLSRGSAVSTLRPPDQRTTDTRREVPDPLMFRDQLRLI